MKFTLFVGCNIPVRVQQYESSARAVLGKLGIDILSNREFKCCGNPIRNTDNQTFIMMAARNLALAEKQKLNMMVLCKCCFGALKKAEYLMKNNYLIQKEVNKILAKENLRYSGTVMVKHFLSIIYKNIGINTLREKITNPFRKLKIATHYGCHALRPSEVTQFDNPIDPTLFDKLVEITGAKSIEWSLKPVCCGAPMTGVTDDLSMDLTNKKLTNALSSGADYLCVACPYCHMQFDKVQQMMLSFSKSKNQLLSILYPQLLGLAMGITSKKLGIKMNALDISNIESFLE